jgi:hypothetical protein
VNNFLILRFQAATMRIPPEQSARRMMQQSLDRADQLLVASRQKVKELRPDTQESAELPNAIARESEQLSQIYAAKFSLVVQGSRRELHPIVNEEGLLIARAPESRELSVQLHRQSVAVTISSLCPQMSRATVPSVICAPELVKIGTPARRYFVTRGIATKSCGGQRAIRAGAPYQLQAPVCMSVFT